MKRLWLMLLTVFAFNANAALMVLDEFDIGMGPGGADIQISGGSPQSTDSTADDGSILGGQRDARLTQFDGGPALGTESTLGSGPLASGSGSDLVWSNADGVKSWFEVVYDGANDLNDASSNYTTNNNPGLVLGDNVDIDGLGGVHRLDLKH